MYALLIVIMALALFSALLYAGASNINLDNYIIKSNKGVVESSAMTLATQYTAYENIKGYILQEANWQTELFSLNRYSPKSIDGTSWSYHNNTDGTYFCMNGIINPVNYKSFKLAELSADGMAFVNVACGSKTSLSYNGSFPAEMAITYWIRN